MFALWDHGAVRSIRSLNLSDDNGRTWTAVNGASALQPECIVHDTRLSRLVCLGRDATFVTEDATTWFKLEIGSSWRAAMSKLTSKVHPKNEVNVSFLGSGEILLSVTQGSEQKSIVSRDHLTLRASREQKLNAILQPTFGQEDIIARIRAFLIVEV